MPRLYLAEPYYWDSDSDSPLRAFPVSESDGETTIPVQDAGYRALALTQPQATIRLVQRKESDTQAAEEAKKYCYDLPVISCDKSDDDEYSGCGIDYDDGTGNGDSDGKCVFRKCTYTSSHLRVPSAGSDEGSSDGESLFSSESGESNPVSVNGSPVLAKRPPLLQSHSMPIVNIEHELKKLQDFDRKYYGITPDDSAAAARHRRQTI